MRQKSSANLAASGFAAAALLLFSGPGVQVVRAESPAPAAISSLPDGETATCRADRTPHQAGVSQVTRRIIERIQAEATKESDVVVLNGRGYNYARPRNPTLELQRLHAEAEIQAETQR